MAADRGGLSLISITNSGYLAQAVKNRPFVGWNSIVAPSSFSMTGSSRVGHSVRNLWSPDTYTQWQTALFTSGQVNDVIMSVDNETEVNYALLAGHNVSDFGGEVTLQHSDDGSTWTTIDSVEPEDNKPIIFYFDAAEDSYFRFLFEQTGASPNDYFYASHVKLGQALILERREFVGVSPNNRRIEKVVNRSDSGRYLGSTLISVTRPYSIQQGNNHGSFVRQYIDPFLDHCQLISTGTNGPTGTFVFVSRPEEFPEEVLYCHAPDNVDRPTNQRPNGMMQWSVSGVAER